MKGMEMLMKSMGLDPEALMGEMNRVASGALAQIQSMQEQLNRIEANQVVLYQLMVGAGLIKSVEERDAEHARLSAPEVRESSDGRVN